MDQLSAHLDRGWDLLQRGDTQGAEVSARRALELDEQAPEAYNLLGYVSALHGEFEEAIEHYQQALALDDTYLEAILNAAEVLIHPLGELEEAERLCEDALELAETEGERVDALLLKFDALLGRNQVESARALCERLPRGPFENPAHAFLVGRALYEVGMPEQAAPLIEAAIQSGPPNAEAYYYLALLEDERGHVAEATEAFLRSRELDLQMPRTRWALSSDTFRDLVQRAVEALPDELRARLGEHETYVSDLPGVEVVVEGVDPRALLLLDAAPAIDRDAPTNEAPEDADPESDRGGVLARRIRLFVYQRNVERLGTGIDTVISELSGALERELESVLGEETSDQEQVGSDDTPAEIAKQPGTASH